MALAVVAIVATSHTTPTKTASNAVEADCNFCQWPPPNFCKLSQDQQNDAQMWMCQSDQLVHLESQLSALIAGPPRFLSHAALQHVEDAWTSYRLRECNLETSPYTGGSYENLVFTSCEVQMTQRRLSEVRGLFPEFSN